MRTALVTVATIGAGTATLLRTALLTLCRVDLQC
jgi:hypothetical protein